MKGWLNDFRADVNLANQNKLDFQVWQPTFIFSPNDPRSKQKQMVTAEDITRVEIKFFPPPKAGKS